MDASTATPSPSSQPSRRETALVIPVPAADPLVGGWRDRFDPSARAGIPAHITILYPFLDASTVDDRVISELRAQFSRENPISFALVAVKHFVPSVLYLEPRPSQPFSRLTMEVWSLYPDHPPYGGRFRNVVPHLTIGEGPHESQYDEIERQLKGSLPVGAVADRVVLMEQEAPGGRWRTRAEFLLGRASRHR
ncbi:MAG: 2'-5' RNA ligase family protein [Chloroflexi bacterium]|nr:2'-5' RNA ligase family protein [Chloroflexota bacterium]HEV8054228.1 2'-5' RNA ligase family protein [Candidatus Limnocylindrales bacterium]